MTSFHVLPPSVDASARPEASTATARSSSPVAMSSTPRGESGTRCALSRSYALRDPSGPTMSSEPGPNARSIALVGKGATGSSGPRNERARYMTLGDQKRKPPPSRAGTGSPPMRKPGATRAGLFDRAVHRDHRARDSFDHSDRPPFESRAVHRAAPRGNETVGRQLRPGRRARAGSGAGAQEASRAAHAATASTTAARGGVDGSWDRALGSGQLSGVEVSRSPSHDSCIAARREATPMKTQLVRLFVLAPLLFGGCAASRPIPLEAGSFRNPRLDDAARKMVVLQAQDAGRPTEVIGVIDVHEPTGEHDAALQNAPRARGAPRRRRGASASSSTTRTATPRASRRTCQASPCDSAPSCRIGPTR